MKLVLTIALLIAAALIVRRIVKNRQDKHAANVKQETDELNERTFYPPAATHRQPPRPEGLLTQSTPRPTPRSKTAPLTKRPSGSTRRHRDDDQLGASAGLLYLGTTGTGHHDSDADGLVDSVDPTPYSSGGGWVDTTPSWGSDSGSSSSSGDSGYSSSSSSSSSDSGSSSSSSDGGGGGGGGSD